MPKLIFKRYWFFLCSLFILMAGFAGPASADWGEGDYRIIKALYGTPDRHIDVTSRLKELAQRDERFRLGNGVFGTDPDKGRVKTLRIEAVSSSGRNRTFEYTEGSWVDGAQFQGWSSGNWGDNDGGSSSGWGDRPGYQDRKEGEYRILQAQYGTAERNVDVTSRLRELAGRDERFRLSNKTFGVDPDKGRVKVLRIYAEGPRGQRTFEYTEGSWVDGAQFAGWSGGSWGNGGWNGGWGGSRPSYNDNANRDRDRDRDPDGLKILRAEYGTNNNRIDITHRLSQRVIMNRLTARVNNDLAGNDPARDQQKRLWVTYSVEGREMRRDVKEGQVLILP